MGGCVKRIEAEEANDYIAKSISRTDAKNDTLATPHPSPPQITSAGIFAALPANPWA